MSQSAKFGKLCCPANPSKHGICISSHPVAFQVEMVWKGQGEKESLSAPAFDCNAKLISAPSPFVGCPTSSGAACGLLEGKGCDIHSHEVTKMLRLVVY